MLERSRSLQIYMKPGLKEDDLMLRVWDACRKHSRPQDVFRSMLRVGLLAMVESGEMPESVIDECGLEALLERRRRRGRKAQEQQQAPVHPYMPPYPYPAAPQYVPQQPPAQQAEPVHYQPPAAPREPAREEPRETAPEPKQEAAPRAGKERPAKAEGGDGQGEGRKGRIGNLM